MSAKIHFLRELALENISSFPTGGQKSHSCEICKNIFFFFFKKTTSWSISVSTQVSNHIHARSAKKHSLLRVTSDNISSHTHAQVQKRIPVTSAKRRLPPNLTSRVISPRAHWWRKNPTRVKCAVRDSLTSVHPYKTSTHPYYRVSIYITLQKCKKSESATSTLWQQKHSFVLHPALGFASRGRRILGFFFIKFHNV